MYIVSTFCFHDCCISYLCVVCVMLTGIDAKASPATKKGKAVSEFVTPKPSKSGEPQISKSVLGKGSPVKPKEPTRQAVQKPIAKQSPFKKELAMEAQSKPAMRTDSGKRSKTTSADTGKVASSPVSLVTQAKPAEEPISMSVAKPVQSAAPVEERVDSASGPWAIEQDREVSPEVSRFCEWNIISFLGNTLLKSKHTGNHSQQMDNELVIHILYNQLLNDELSTRIILELMKSFLLHMLYYRYS